jgi:lipopolysaccharide transport system permease protein
MEIQKNTWTTVIRPQNGRLDINLIDIWRYRDLIILFVRRDFVAVYKQTILGPLWFLLQPLLSTLVFVIVFGFIAKIPTDGLPQILFYLSGIVIWQYFASCLVKTSDTFVANAGMFGKVYFPRLIVPISIVLTNLLTLGIQLCLFIIFWISYYARGANIHLTAWIFTIPFLVLQMAALGLGLGILISSMTTKYRDLNFIVGFGVQLWMYATPIVYPMSQIPAAWQGIYSLNPMAAIVEIFRLAFLGTGSVQPWQWGISICVTVIVLLVGIMLFSRIEKTFMDTV